jgi:hypothetical protein
MKNVKALLRSNNTTIAFEEKKQATAITKNRIIEAQSILYFKKDYSLTMPFNI